MVELNFTGLMCEAFGYNERLYKDIDKLYQEKKYDYYKCAKGSKLYNHPIIIDKSLIQEEYCKKILGILEYTTQNPDDENVIYNVHKLIKKGWAYIYAYVDTHNKIDIGEFIDAFKKKNKGLDNLTDDDVCGNTIILFMLSLNTGKEIVRDNMYNDILSTLYGRMEAYETKDKIPVHENLESVKKAMFNEIGVVKKYNDIPEHLLEDPVNTHIQMLFDYENITPSLFNQIKFTNEDINQIINSYIYFNKGVIDIEDLCITYINAMYIKYLIKAYKQVKEHYFANNKETIYVDLELAERELNDVRSRLDAEVTKSMNYISELDVKEKKIKKLEQELNLEKQKNNELNGLREFMFGMDQVEYIEEDIDISKLKNIKGIIIGGHEKWQSRMKEILPEFTFIHTDMLNFDITILNGFDRIFIYTNYLNHGMYYKVMEYVRGREIKINYLNHKNEDIIVKEILRKC